MNHLTEPTPWPPLTEAHLETHWSLAQRFLGDFVRNAPAHVIAGLTMQYPDLGAALGHVRIVADAQGKDLSAVSDQP